MHQLIIIRLITGCAFKLRDAGLIGKSNPYFGYKDPFKIQTDNVHAKIIAKPIKLWNKKKRQPIIKIQ